MNIKLNNPVKLTESAINRLKKIKKNNLKFRIYIFGGGCSGFKYGFTIDNTINNDDYTFLIDSIMIIIDNMSLQYLIGSLIDYQEELKGSKFLVINPHAKTTCSCGYSFSI